MTTVNVTATNLCGTASCSFTVLVNDTQVPTISCPTNITVTSLVGSCTRVVNYTGTANDNCAGSFVQLVSGPASGSAFPLGTTTITLRAVDAAGNVSANCSFTVTVLDGQLPFINTQPINRTVCAGGSAVFSVSATNAVSYQWQNWNGAAWVNVSGATASTYTIANTTLEMNTNTYRVIITGVCSSAISNPATLIVNILPTVSIVASPFSTLIPGQFTSILSQVNPGGGNYNWQFNGSTIIA